MKTTLHHQSYHTPASSYNDAIYEVRPADLPSLIAYRLLINHPNSRFLVKHQRQKKNKPLTLLTAIILPFISSRWWSATNIALNPKKKQNLDSQPQLKI
jgi:reverse gyrase